LPQRYSEIASYDTSATCHIISRYGMIFCTTPGVGYTVLSAILQEMRVDQVTDTSRERAPLSRQTLHMEND